jgi:sugar phosphate isomerase/epimerase
MKFSIFTVSVPEYGYEETAKTLRELGYDGVEWRVAGPVPAEKPANWTYEGRYWSYNKSTLSLDSLESDAARAAQACKAEGLEICALATATNIDAAADVERILKTAARLGCRNVRICVPSYDGTTNYRELFAKARSQAEALVPLSMKYGVRINYETHMGNIIPSASAAYRFVQGLDPRCAGIIFDPGNMVYEGFENYQLGIELLGEYLAHVHIKNAAWFPKEIPEAGIIQWHPDWAPFRKGYADIAKLLKNLEASGYDGYVSVEDFSNEEDTYTKIKDNIEFMKSITG